MKKKLWLASALITTLIVGAFGVQKLNASNTKEEPTVEYAYATVQKGDLIVDFPADGEIDIPIHSYGFKTSGVISELLVETGDTVTAGTLLATLDSTSAMNSLQDARLSYQSALVNQIKNSMNYMDNLEDYDYQLDLLKQKIETASSEYGVMLAIPDAYSSREIKDQALEVAQAKAEYANFLGTSQPQSTSSNDQISVERALITIEKCEDELDKTQLVSLVDGKVIDVDGIISQYVSNESAIIKVEESGSIYISAEIQELDIVNVSMGQKAYVELEALPGAEYVAYVTDINRDPIIDNNGIVNYEVVLILEEGHPQIMDGMTATATFVLMEKQDVLMIPNKAVSRSESYQVVNLMTSDDTAVQTVITTGMTDGKYVEVLEGLESGQQLVYEE